MKVANRKKCTNSTALYVRDVLTSICEYERCSYLRTQIATMLVVVRRTVLAIRIKYECKIICINIIPSVKGQRRKVKSEKREYENKGAKKGCEMSDGGGGSGRSGG